MSGGMRAEPEGSDRTSRLVDDLVADLEPTAALAPLTLMASGLVLLGGIVVTLFAFASGGATDSLYSPSTRSTSLGVLFGLVLTATAGCFAGLASAIPGRERVTRWGAVLAGCGIVLGVVSAVSGIGAEAPDPTVVASGVPHCIGVAAAAAFVPSLFGALLARRCFVLAPVVTAALVLLGTTALGALAVHLTCAEAGAWHVLAGHQAAPVVATVLATPLLVVWFRHRAG